MKERTLTDDLMDSIVERVSEALDVRSGPILPCTSTIEDNDFLSNEIMQYCNRYRGESSCDLERKSKRLFKINDQSEFDIIKAPEAVGYIIVHELKKNHDSCIDNGKDENLQCLLPEDAEIEEREAKVLKEFNLHSRAKEVDRWFADFFGPKTRTIRKRWQRFFFVVYLEHELSKRQK